MRGQWGGWNLPPGVFESDPYFTDESGDVCEHSSPICKECQDEDDKAKAAEETGNRKYKMEFRELELLILRFMASDARNNELNYTLPLSNLLIFARKELEKTDEQQESPDENANDLS